jgi:hypothetical protein
MDWIVKKLLALLGPGVLAKLVRKALAALAGYLVLKNIIPAGSVEAFISANVEMVVGVITFLITWLGGAVVAKKPEVPVVVK